MYFGDIGPNAVTLTDYFARYGAVCPDDINPAEFMLEAIGNGSKRRIGPKDWAEVSSHLLSHLLAPRFALLSENRFVIDLPRVSRV